MIGVYDYTVILTYLSVISGVSGIMVCLNGVGHPFYGTFFLLLSGLCDTFDGRVARSKRGRTDRQKSFGVQIDSLADLISFGVLPPCIGLGMVRTSDRLTTVPNLHVDQPGEKRVIYPLFLIMIIMVYVLAALIRLSYFNVLEEEKKKLASPAMSGYIGLPVTSAALIFPTVMLFQFLTKADLTLLYFGVMLLTSLLFVSRIKVPKPNLRVIILLIGIGAVEFVAFVLIKYYLHIQNIIVQF